MIIAELASAAAEMLASTQESAAAQRELQQSFAEIVAAAQQASTSTVEVAANVVQIRAAAQRFQESTRATQERVVALQRLMLDTVDGVEQLTLGITTGLATARNTIDAVRAIDAQGVEVRNVAQAVASVSQQVNLLAFNAALEASRAGKHGMGFSVVADQVRRQAQKSSEHAATIDTLAASVTAAVAKVVLEMDATLKDNASWLAEAGQLAEKMRKAQDSLAALLEAARDIDRASQDLGESMAINDKNAAQIAGAARSSLTAVTQADAALVQQGSALRGIEEAAGELASRTEVGQAARDEMDDEELSTIADELSATIQEVSSAANQVAASVQQIAEEAERQSLRAAENIPVVESAAEWIGRVRVKAQENEAEMRIVEGVVLESARAIAAVIANIGGLEARNTGNAGNLRRLQQEMLNVDVITDSLSNVSMYIGLLSVNGRIEGARSGDEGAGFTKVAEDIRQLAESSADTVIELRRVVRHMQLAMNQTGQELDRSGIIIRAEVDKARRTTDRLVTVDKDLAEVTRSIAEILRASEVADAAIPPIRKSIVSINEAAARTATACGQASSASTEQGSAMSQLSRSVDEIAARIRQLSRR